MRKYLQEESGLLLVKCSLAVRSKIHTMACQDMIHSMDIGYKPIGGKSMQYLIIKIIF